MRGIKMRIGKCPECKKEMYISGMNWDGWRLFKCKNCNYSLNNDHLSSNNFTQCLKELKVM
jgi:transposase-like protein